MSGPRPLSPAELASWESVGVLPWHAAPLVAAGETPASHRAEARARAAEVLPPPTRRMRSEYRARFRLCNVLVDWDAWAPWEDKAWADPVHADRWADQGYLPVDAAAWSELTGDTVASAQDWEAWCSEQPEAAGERDPIEVADLWHTACGATHPDDIADLVGAGLRTDLVIAWLLADPGIDVLLLPGLVAAGMTPESWRAREGAPAARPGGAISSFSLPALPGPTQP